VQLSGQTLPEKGRIADCPVLGKKPVSFRFDAFHSAACANGVDNGAPGISEQYARTTTRHSFRLQTATNRVAGIYLFGLDRIRASRSCSWTRACSAVVARRTSSIASLTFASSGSSALISRARLKRACLSS